MDALSAIQTIAGSQLTAPLNAPAPSLPAPDLAALNSDSPPQAASAGGASGGSFQNLLGSFVGEVNDKQVAAGDAITGLLSGKNVTLHQAMISMEEASVSFQMMVEVRNKLLDSYQELMRMQI
jgi:flagellar hook-basal body complex protein FliE